MTTDAVAAFVERQRRERIDAGLPPTIVDASTLTIIAALVRRPVTADGGDAG